jgi:hypothetical protein
MTKVASLFGGPTGERETDQSCIETLEEWLEMARSGEIVGVVVVGLRFDRTTFSECSGMAGGYSMIGALEVAKADLLDVVRGP